MNWRTLTGLAAVIVVALAAHGYAAAPAPEGGVGVQRGDRTRPNTERITPEQREKMRTQMAERAKGREGAEDRDVPGGFLYPYLQTDEEAKKAQEAHREQVKAIVNKLRELAETTKTKVGAAQGREEREKVIAAAKTQARALLGEILDEQIKFRKQITEIVEKDREAILDKAVAQVFPARRGRAAGDGERPRGERGGDRGGTRGAGKGDPGAPPPPPEQ